MMKRWIKSIIRSCWRLSSPIRRPLDRKLETRLSRIVEAQVREGTHAQLDLLLRVMTAARHESNVQGGETNLALDALVREVSRLQFQLEAMEDRILDLADNSDRLGLLDGSQNVEAAA